MLITLESIKDDKFYIKLDKIFAQSLLKSVSNEKLPYRDQQLARTLGMEFNKKIKKAFGIRMWYYGNRNIPMTMLKILVGSSKVYTWNDVEKNLLGIKSLGLGFTRFIVPKFPITDTKELGLLIGHILGDGWIDTRFLQPCYCNSNQELLKEFEDSMSSIFGVKPRIWIQKEKKFEDRTQWLGRTNMIDDVPKGLVATLFYPKSVGLILFRIFDKFISNRKKKIPEISFNLSTEFKCGLVRSLYDDEGSVSYRGRCIRLYQDNFQLLEDTRKLLLGIGISSGDVRTYIKHNKKRYYFDIYGRKNFVKFQKFLGFTSTKKRTELHKLVASHKR